MVEVLIGEMFGSDQIRPKDYKRAAVVDDEVRESETEHSEERAEDYAQKGLTEPTLLEMSGKPTIRPLEPSLVRTPRRCFPAAWRA